LRHVHSEADHAVLKQVEDIARQQFPLATKMEIADITRRLREPMMSTFMPMLLVIEDLDGHLSAFASVLLYPPQKLAHLEFISTAPKKPGGGLGSLLYERLREECRAQGCNALLFECLPDEPGPSRDEATLKINRQRLKFYEFYGARPLINTEYEGPSKPGGDIGAFLVLDPLDTDFQLPRKTAQLYVADFLAYKYPKDCPPNVIARVVDKIVDDPVRLREPRYFKNKDKVPERLLSDRPHYAIVINDHHDIHHVRDRGYVEAPVRISKIRDELNKTRLFVELAEEATSVDHITAVHSKEYVNYLKKICLSLPEKKSVYPQVFPVRNKARPPKDLAMQAGYYCIDTFTPLNKNAYLAARAAVDCALTAANAMLDRYPMAYALVRPPGHHAERSAFGGFCYFNSSAVSAHYLSRYGKVVVLDVDFHHGNGTQDIFYQRSDVYTVSIHGHPTTNYPFFSGFADETGEGEGLGFNLNIPLPDDTSPERYRTALKQAITAIRKFNPDYLVLALGLDTAKGDPTGTWTLEPDDFRQNGQLLAGLKLPTLVVQEGGYRTRTLGQNARAFFEGFFQGHNRRGHNRRGQSNRRGQ
jgi:acetoin utilization deacetylase AcuC-like enzyme/GNAT superfamily N-acetyltransferase